MNENVTQLIDKLATKLGTTTEYLWAVLVRQAPLTGIVNLLVMAALVVGVIWWGRFVQKQTTCPPPKEGERYGDYAKWNNDGGVFFAWASVFVAGLTVALVIGANLSLVVAALFNPEYWALKQILP